MKRRNKTITVLLLFTLIAALCVIAFSVYQLMNTQLAYLEGDRSYGELRSQVVRRPDVQREDTTADSGFLVKALDSLLDITTQRVEPTPSVTIEPKSDADSALDPIDFDVLNAINPDTAAWLYSPGTAIDNPVVNAKDYDWYLRHLLDGTYNVNGTLFLDYNCEPDFAGRLSIIYGHNMQSGKMFGSLTGYKDQKYFEKHPYMYLYTKDQDYRIDLKYGCVIAAGEWREKAFMYELNLDALLTYAAAHTTFRSDVKYTDSDKIIVLSTCSYEFDDARYFVVGVLRPVSAE